MTEVSFALFVILSLCFIWMGFFSIALLLYFAATEGM